MAHARVDRERASMVCWSPRERDANAGSERLVAATAVHVFIAQRLPIERQRACRAEWLAHGLGHWVIGSMGACDVFLVRDAVFGAVAGHGGEFVAAAAQLAAVGRLPSLSSLLATAGDDLDFDQHVAAHAWVAWLARSASPAKTGDGAVVARARSPLAELMAAVLGGARADAALATVLGVDLATVEQRFVESLLVEKKPAERRREPPRVRGTHPHAAIYVYVREPVADRHRKVVAAALAARAAALTSAFRTIDGAPQVQIGPVDRGANFWKPSGMGKQIDRTWPFVVVLEYEAAGAQEAYLDCFRRPTGRGDDGGWMLDPGVGFVEHHNAQMATDLDEQFGYVAFPDTPTGTHVGGSEFVHRGRVRWRDGRQAHLGTWTVLTDPNSVRSDRWYAQHQWLVDWRVAASRSGRGAVAVSALADPARELAVWGTGRVLRLPEVPPGLRAGRGR